MSEKKLKINLHTALLGISKLAVLTICFVVAFGFALSIEIFDTDQNIENGQTITNIAKAADGNHPMGGTTPIIYDQYGGDIKSSDIGFPGNKTSWSTGNLTFNNTTYDTNNVSLAFEDGDVDVCELTSIDKGYKVACKLNGNDAAVAVINISLKGFLNKLIGNNDKVATKVSGSFDLYKGNGNSGWDAIGFKILAANKNVHAKDHDYTNVLAGSRRPGYTYIEDSKNWRRCTFDKINLTSANPNLAICVACGETNGWGWDFEFQARNFQY